ncbi:hypothetical protein J7T55_010337 [Diaporthe amygdali]|uniref:uncharacterized protein n=1 Tax=Phomopsis amygdali TaxID=1214568 RepID=UPI0022FDF1FA|nr:uncharacterized protein J7T55_010337 [Diaporthe amygdali]KAJ0107730.1 hypothetical protein J7T55_010337 [Diaporthe amygdali]
MNGRLGSCVRVKGHRQAGREVFSQLQRGASHATAPEFVDERDVEQELDCSCVAKGDLGVFYLANPEVPVVERKGKTREPWLETLTTCKSGAAAKRPGMSRLVSRGNLQGTVVDIGGGSGHISMALARLFPHLSFVVQDLGSGMLDEGQKLLTDDVRDRVSFVQQSFFEPQPYRGAAAFLLRQCTHNWADKDVVNMFKAVVPGLEGSKPSTPLLVNDIVMPEPNTWGRLDEREVREIDMIMMISFGAKQRTLAEFKVLLAEADLRYEVSQVHATGPVGLLEIYLRR